MPEAEHRQNRELSGKRIRLHEASALNDIAYRGPLNCRTFQILGWFCIVAAQIAIMMSVGSHFGTGKDFFISAEKPIGDLAKLALPFLLIFNFTLIMNGQRTFRALLLKNFFAMAGLWAAYSLLLGHFVTGTLELLSTDPSRVAPNLDTLLSRAAENGFFCFNVFVDLFLCTLVMYFLNARPKRFFTGRKILIFRLFTLLPVAWEIVSMVLKVRSVRGELTLSLYVYPLLTVKPPMTFVLFVLLAAFLKTRELRFCRHGRTREEYQEFLGTNRNSLSFSVFLAILLVLVSVTDWIAVSLLPASGGVTDPVYRALGFGESRYLFVLAPLVLLFSYTRRPKRTGLGIAVPLAGFVLIILVYLQGILQILHLTDLPKYNFDSYMPVVLTYVDKLRK